jgi:CxxC-x17-CxxC domain-containing protein
MNNYSFGGGGKKRRNDFIGGRPRSDANYGPKKKSFDKKPGFRGGDRRNDRGGDRELFKTTCTTCGKPCEVPFRPDGSKPVLCRDCFAQNQPADRSDFRSPRDFNRGGDRNFRKPERDFGARKAPEPDTTNYVALTKQVAALEAKLDEVLNLLKITETSKESEIVGESEAPAAAATPKKPAKKVAKKVAKVAKKVAKKAAKKTKK